MIFSVELKLDNGGTVIFDNVVSCVIEESTPSPDEIPEEGEEDRAGNMEPDIAEEEKIEEETEEI